MAKQYDNDFKLNTVKLVVEEGKVASQAARDLGIMPKTLHGWVAQYKDGSQTSVCGQWAHEAISPGYKRFRA